MVVILRRADLPRHHSALEVAKIRLHHLGLDPATINKAELIVFLEDSKVNVLRGTECHLENLCQPPSCTDLSQNTRWTEKGIQTCKPVSNSITVVIVLDFVMSMCSSFG